MMGELEKIAVEAAAKKIDTIAKYLAVLSAALGLFFPNKAHLAGVVIIFVGSLVAIVSARRLAGLINWVKKWWKGKGRHNGTYVTDFTAETIPPDHFEGTTIRRCPESQPSCGSPADHGKETWPSP